jgi:hypothetical protein
VSDYFSISVIRHDSSVSRLSHVLLGANSGHVVVSHDLIEIHIQILKVTESEASFGPVDASGFHVHLDSFFELERAYILHFLLLVELWHVLRLRREGGHVGVPAEGVRDPYASDDLVHL